MLLQKGITVPNDDPANLRLREISSAPSRRIGKVFPDALSVKKAMVYVYSKRMLIQVIEGPETVVNQDKDICFFIQVPIFFYSFDYFCFSFVFFIVYSFLLLLLCWHVE